MEHIAEKMIHRGGAVYDAVLFDLDGTLTESHPGILSCVKLALQEMGKPVPSPDQLRKFIGPPLAYSFTQFCGMTMKEAEEGIERYRFHYNRGGIFECSVYEGIFPLLKELKERGVKLAVATAKPESMAMRVLEHFGLSAYMDCISANQEDEKGTGKVQLIEAALRELEVSPEKAVMVGDTRFDCEGARLAGVDFAGALYGYGGEEELEKAGAVKLAASPGELRRFLLP